MPVSILSSAVRIGRPDAQGDCAVESTVEIRNDTDHTWEAVELVVRLCSASGAALATDTVWEGVLHPGEHQAVEGLTVARLEGRDVGSCTARLTLRRAERASAPCAFTLDVAALDEAFASSRTVSWDHGGAFVGAMRLHAFTHPTGDALVLQALLTTDVCDSGLGLEVWGYGPAFGPDQVHRADPVERVAQEELVHVGDDGSVRYHSTEVTVDGEGAVVERHERAPTHHSVLIDGDYVQVALDLEDELRRHLDPVAGLAVLLGRGLHRYEVFLDEDRLRAHVGLPADAVHLFAVDEWLHPDALEPASSSPDLMALVRALATRDPHPALPVAASHAAHLARRLEVLGAWGFPSGWG